MNYLFSDFIYRARYKLKDYFLRCYWKIHLGQLGKKSFVRSRVRVIGNPRRMRIGNNFKVYENCVIAVGKGEIELGDNGFLGVGTYINSSYGLIKIGNGVAIAPYCRFFTFSHHYSEDKSIRESYYSKDIIIGNDVLIGTNSVILPGVTVGSGAIVASCSVVDRDVEPYTIVGGIPAKIIKRRTVKGTE